VKVNVLPARERRGQDHEKLLAVRRWPRTWHAEDMSQFAMVTRLKEFRELVAVFEDADLRRRQTSMARTKTHKDTDNFFCHGRRFF
jgi:hypothetical protein